MRHTLYRNRCESEAVIGEWALWHVNCIRSSMNQEVFMFILILIIAVSFIWADEPLYLKEDIADSAITVALQASPEISISRSMVEVAEAQLSEARYFLFHSLALHFNAPIIQNVPAAQDGTSTYIVKPVDLTLVLSLDFGDVLTFPHRIRKEKAKLRQARYHLKKTKNEITREVRKRFSEVKKCEKELVFIVEEMESAKVNYTIAKQRFTSREISYEQLHNAIAIFKKSCRAVEEKTSHLEIALANLKQVIGEDEEGFYGTL